MPAHFLGVETHTRHGTGTNHPSSEDLFLAPQEKNVPETGFFELLFETISYPAKRSRKASHFAYLAACWLIFTPADNPSAP